MLEKSDRELFPLPVTLFEVDEDGSGKGIFYFHEIDDYLYGVLVGRVTHKTLHYPLRTYVMKPCYRARQNGREMIVKDNQAVEFPRNVKLRRLIEDHWEEILGKPIKVIYTGKRGRYKKYIVAEAEGMGLLAKVKFKQKSEKIHKKRSKRKGVKHGKARKKTTSKRRSSIGRIRKGNSRQASR